MTSAADRAGLTPSGYAAEVAVAAALRLDAPSLVPWNEALAGLALARGQLRRIGTNLNQAARVLNVDGEAPVWLERACAVVERSVDQVDVATTEMRRVARGGGSK